MNRTTIEMNGQTIDLKFGLLASKKFFEKSAANNFFEGESLNEIGISTLLHVGYINDCVVKQTEPSLTFEDFSNLVEVSILNGNTKQIIEAVKVWMESTAIKASIESLKKAKSAVKRNLTPAKKVRKAK